MRADRDRRCARRDIPDETDRCPDLAIDCTLDAGDPDGCPDTPAPPRVHVPMRHDDRALLVEIADDTRRLRDGVDLIVVGHALPNEPPGPALERATAVALRLEDDGVPLARLLARADGPIAPGDPEPGAMVEITTTGCPPAPATGSSASR